MSLHWELEREFLNHAKNGNLEGVCRCLNLNVSTRFSLCGRDFEALSLASANGHLDVVKELIPVSQVSARHSAALSDALTYRHLDIARELIPHSDLTDPDFTGVIAVMLLGYMDGLELIMSAYENLALKDEHKDDWFKVPVSSFCCSAGDHLSVLELVHDRLSHVLSEKDWVSALSSAVSSKKCDLDCVRFLRDVLPTGCDVSHPVKVGILYGRRDCLKIILPQCDPDEIWNLPKEDVTKFVRYLAEVELQADGLLKKHKIVEGAYVKRAVGL